MAPTFRRVTDDNGNLGFVTSEPTNSTWHQANENGDVGLGEVVKDGYTLKPRLFHLTKMSVETGISVDPETGIATAVAKLTSAPLQTISLMWRRSSVIVKKVRRLLAPLAFRLVLGFDSITTGSGSDDRIIGNSEVSEIFDAEMVITKFLPVTATAPLTGLITARGSQVAILLKA